MAALFGFLGLPFPRLGFGLPSGFLLRCPLPLQLGEPFGLLPLLAQALLFGPLSLSRFGLSRLLLLFGQQRFPLTTQFRHPRLLLPLLLSGLLPSLGQGGLLLFDFGEGLLGLLALPAQPQALLLGNLGLGHLVHQRSDWIGRHDRLVLKAGFGADGICEIVPPKPLVRRLDAQLGGQFLQRPVEDGHFRLADGRRARADQCVLRLPPVQKAPETPAVPAEFGVGVPVGMLHHVGKDEQGAGGRQFGKLQAGFLKGFHQIGAADRRGALLCGQLA